MIERIGYTRADGITVFNKGIANYAAKDQGRLKQLFNMYARPQKFGVVYRAPRIEDTNIPEYVLPPFPRFAAYCSHAAFCCRTKAEIAEIDAQIGAIERKAQDLGIYAEVTIVALAAAFPFVVCAFPQTVVFCTCPCTRRLAQHPLPID